MAADILCSFLWRLSYYWRKALGSVRKKKVFYLGHLLLCCLHWEPDYPQVLKCWRYSVHCRAGCCIYNAISCINCNEHLFSRTGTEQSNGNFGSFAAIGSGSGLSIGGIISTYLSWHWVF